MPFDRAGTPAERHARFDGRIVLPEACGKALKRRQGTLRGTLQPGIELLRLALAHQVSKRLGQRNGFGEIPMLRLELRNLVGVLSVPVLLPFQNQGRRPPDRPRGGPWAPRREGQPAVRAAAAA